HIGQILSAFNYLKEQQGKPVDELDVDLLVKSDPTHPYRGKLSRSKIAALAVPHQNDSSNENEPVVFASVRLDGDDIPEDLRVPRNLFTTGTEVHAKVRCGNHRMGYSLFYGMWEFLYESVFFKFF